MNDDDRRDREADALDALIVSALRGRPDDLDDLDPATLPELSREEMAAIDKQLGPPEKFIPRLMKEVEIRAAVRAFILAEFLPGEDPAELKDDTPLVTGGILDHVDAARVGDWLAERYGIGDITADAKFEDLDSVAAIARMVRERLAAGGPP
jgi:acyl carrier protein